MTTEEQFPFEIVQVPWNDCNAVKLRKMQKDEFTLRYPEDPGEPGKTIDEGDCLVFLLIRQKSNPDNGPENIKYVAAAGLRKADENRAEVKRMFVIPEARGPPFRLGERLISSLEQHAKQFGFEYLLVETGSFAQQARRFYHRVGFTSCEAFPPYDKGGEAPLSVFLEKKIR